MANTGAEPIGSMGTDTPIAALSDKPRLLFDYFSQLFAQVTNPPLDAIREELVTSLAGTIGPEANLLEPAPASCRQVVLPFPVISNDDLAKIRHINRDGDMPGFITHVSRGLYPVEGGGAAMAERIDEICAEVSEAIAGGARIIVLSDRHSTAEMAPIPSLLLTGAVHHHLVREKTRTQVGLLVEAGDVREVHHVALLIGYGAAAVNPYLAMESVEDLARDAYYVKTEPEQAVANLIKALGKGVLKVMSKMGVSTVASYTGAQIFEAVGLSQTVVDKYFTGTTSKLGGIELDTIADEVARRHAVAYPPAGIAPAHRAAGHRRRVPVAPRGRAAPVRPRHRVPAPALHPDRALRHLQAVHPAGRRAVRAADDAARDVPVQGRRRQPDASRSRSTRSSRSPRSSSGSPPARCPTGRSARRPTHPRDRDEPAGRQVQHRRGRRGPRAPPRPGAPQRDQAGRLRPVRRDRRVPHQLRRHPDQDGPGRQARRGRSAAGAEGLPVDRQDPVLHARAWA